MIVFFCVQIDEIDFALKIEWSDNHESIHSINWLQKRSFDPTIQKEHLQQTFRPKKLSWHKHQFDSILQTFNFDKILNSDDTLKSWLTALSINGVALIENAPITPNECRKLANRVGFIRKTHYGEEFIVENKPNSTNVAYLSTPLQMHTDLPYYDYKPGINLLHCLVQSVSDGAFNLLTDGFVVANIMKEKWPQFYQLLTTVLVNWNDIGKDGQYSFYNINRSPMIWLVFESYRLHFCIMNYKKKTTNFSLDRDGQIERINHSIPQRDSYFTVSIEVVDAWYQALAKFIEITHNESVSFKTRPGDILTFDNIRLLHGRTKYQDSIDNKRFLVGAYLDWDEVYSKLRVLSINNNIH